MRKATIFANGEIAADSISLPTDGVVITADGGARHCMNLNIKPQVLIGDLDSLTAAEIETLASDGVDMIRHPAEKDETDLELALEYALQLGANEITLYGLLGGRWDMTFANLLLLAAPRYNQIQFRIVHGKTTAYILRSGETLEIHATIGSTVSAIPLNGPASGVTYQGLLWSLEGDTLPFGTPRGVSNEMLEAEVQISLDKGILLIFVINVENRKSTNLPTTL